MAISICYVTKHKENSRRDIFTFLDTMDDEKYLILRGLRLFLAEIMFSTSNTISEENLKFLAKKLISAVIEKINQGYQNKKPPSKIMDVYLISSLFERRLERILTSFELNYEQEKNFLV